MFKLTISTRIALLNSLFVTIILLTTAIAFGVSFYWLVEQDIRSFLQNQTIDLVNDQITYSDNQIKYKYGPSGQTISSRLRSSDLSAIIYDSNLTPISTYGYYHDLETSNKLDSVKNISLSKTTFFDFTSSDGIDFESYSAPLVIDGHTVGLIQVAKQTQFIRSITRMSITILSILLPVSIFFIWLISHFVSTTSLSPLKTVIKKLQLTKSHELLEKIVLPPKSTPEILTLTSAYNSMIDRISESFSKQKDFIAHASHELKTPLTQAVSSLELALIKEDQDSKHKYISQVKNSLFELNQILETLLTLAKSTDPNASPSKSTTFTLSPVISRILSNLSHQIEQKSLVIHNMVDHNLHVHTNQHVLEIILGNIISNSIKYNTDQGSIAIQASQIGKSLEISISDTGIGMTSEEVAKIFDKFVGRGTGLGMSIVNKLCKLYGLEITISSSPGAGTTVRLLI